MAERARTEGEYALKSTHWMDILVSKSAILASAFIRIGHWLIKYYSTPRDFKFESKV